ncbi:MAG: heme A synthase [Alphaproteobacteria bacterium]|nr:heme A synthase [Alphaproteobacteria bacterium]
MSNTNHEPRTTNHVFYWLIACALMVALMVAVGGYTRLSGSGLSITQWKPIHGVVPPLNLQEWQEEFDAYRATPQFAKVNSGMSLDEFKGIFWPEFLHRLLGRLVGLVFLLPLVYFAVRKKISRRFGLRLAAIFALGGVQGFMGWFMVASGLVDNPYVSHIRLAMHLSLAFLIFALILWAALDVRHPGEGRDPRLTGLNRKTWMPAYAGMTLWFAILCAQIILGALVAGLHAGLIYNTWPLMDGQLAPADIATNTPVLLQFIHRKLAIVVALGFPLWWWWQRKNQAISRLYVVVMGLIFVQFVLGVLTLIYAVPLALALAHQLNALLLFAFSVGLMHKLRRLM